MVHRFIEAYEESQGLVDVLPSVHVNENGIAECHSEASGVVMQLAGVVADERVGRFERVPLIMSGLGLKMLIDANEPLAVGFYFGVADSGSVDPEQIIGAVRQPELGRALIVDTAGAEVPINLRTIPDHVEDVRLIRQVGLKSQGLPMAVSRLLREQARINLTTGAIDIAAPVFVDPENGPANHFLLRGYDISAYDAVATGQGVDPRLGISLVGAFDLQVDLV